MPFFQFSEGSIKKSKKNKQPYLWVKVIHIWEQTMRFLDNMVGGFRVFLQQNQHGRSWGESWLFCALWNMTNICYNYLFLSLWRLSIMQNPVSVGKANQTPRPAGMKTQCLFSICIMWSPSKPEHISLNALQILSHLLIVRDSVLQYRNSYFTLLQKQVH